MRRLLGIAFVVPVACMLVQATPAIAGLGLSVGSLSVRPSLLPSSGGFVTITARVNGGGTCSLRGDLDPTDAVPCRSGRVDVRVRVPRNGCGCMSDRAVWVEVVRGRRRARSRSASVRIAAAHPTRATPLAPDPVDAERCAPGPECDYGASSYAAYETWGDVLPEGLGDCTIAAAANWIQIVLGHRPDPAVIGFEYAQAGGSISGLLLTRMFDYWYSDEIGGSRLTRYYKYGVTRSDIENDVRDYTALIAELYLLEGTYLAQYEILAAGPHVLVVIGFTPAGPLVVSWGQVLQMTWEQWADEAVVMYGVEASLTGG